MNFKILKIVIPLFIVLFALGCSELNDDLTDPGQINIHVEGIANTSSPNFHANTFSENNWNVEFCQQCHASDYSGGTVDFSCNDCHTDPGGPEACNTCHGSFDDYTRIAPPTDLGNNVSTDNPGVGAHERHVYNMTISSPLSCYDCHTNQSVEGESYVSSHIDGLPAEMSIEGYNYSANTCADTYCHGNFVFDKNESRFPFGYYDNQIVGNNYTPVWTTVNGSQAQCGTCHGLPPQGHIYAREETCVTCHPDVVDADLNIVDPLKHGDGNIQLISENILSDPDCDFCHSNGSTQPFIALAGVTDVSKKGVGFHNEHLFEVSIALTTDCEDCHNVPAEYSSAGHFDNSADAEVDFINDKYTALGEDPFYETEILTCNNTYCHGNFEFKKSESDYPWAYTGEVIKGNSMDLIWNQEIYTFASPAACGTCHGLPPTGHIEADLNECQNCHAGVIDENGNIIDKVKHLDGKPNVFGN